MLPEEPGYICSMAPFTNDDQMVLSDKDFHLNGPVHYCSAFSLFFFCKKSTKFCPSAVPKQIH